MAQLRKNIVEIKDILLRLQKDLADTEALFDELINTTSLSNPPSTIATVLDPLQQAKQQKFMYMTVALICSYWEGASSKIKNIPGVGQRTFNYIYKNSHNDIYSPWYKKNIHTIGIIRNCIAHHSGRVASYKRYIKAKYPKDAKKRAIKAIPRKYYYDPLNDNAEIKLKSSDIKEFLGYANKAIPEMLRDVSILFP